MTFLRHEIHISAVGKSGKYSLLPPKKKINAFHDKVVEKRLTFITKILLFIFVLINLGLLENI